MAIQTQAQVYDKKLIPCMVPALQLTYQRALVRYTSHRIQNLCLKRSSKSLMLVLLLLFVVVVLLLLLLLLMLLLVLTLMLQKVRQNRKLKSCKEKMWLEVISKNIPSISYAGRVLEKIFWREEAMGVGSCQQLCSCCVCSQLLTKKHQGLKLSKKGSIQQEIKSVEKKQLYRLKRKAFFHFELFTNQRD